MSWISSAANSENDLDLIIFGFHAIISMAMFFVMVRIVLGTI